eukprot:TRINITY_DN9114_c0_g2_i1.p1 TRINITY_DN9114_c0_g2~~TRINITY_DN9114_c0_g2_i1.p1  ORF type:complete len:250 (-),score=17.82 TRINITY_DN9114_c0_g2_i1:105-854(-)
MTTSSDDEEKPVMYDASTGLPYLTRDSKNKSWSQSITMFVVLNILPLMMGALIACAIYLPNQSLYNDRMRRLNFPSDVGTEGGSPTNMGLGYLYIALFVFAILTRILNLIPTLWKSQVMPGNAGNLRSNLAIYKVNVPAGSASLPAVVMDEDGDVGKYNRANRALHHFNENSLPVGLNIVAVGLIFGLPVMIIAILYAISRIWYQIGYTTGGYGMGCCQHGLAFTCQGMLCVPTIEVLVLITGIKMFTL